MSVYFSLYLSKHKRSRGNDVTLGRLSKYLFRHDGRFVFYSASRDSVVCVKTVSDTMRTGLLIKRICFNVFPICYRNHVILVFNYQSRRLKSNTKYQLTGKLSQMWQGRERCGRSMTLFFLLTGFNTVKVNNKKNRQTNK